MQKTNLNSVFWIAVSVGILYLILGGKKVMSAVTKTSRGMRNNNPFNMRVSASQWKGLTGEDDKGFCVFDTLENGVRAGVINLRNGYFKKGLSLKEIVSKYAPASDNNNERAYLNLIISFNKAVFDEDFVPRSIEDKVLVCKAILRMENGFDTGLSDETIKRYV